MSKSAEKSAASSAAAFKLRPSEFLRGHRPENYSDSLGRDAYLLDAPTLEYHLDTLTGRNQTNAFEFFCRKLCERAICPNLRPQTGPEGGGDSKADAETFPVSDERAAIYIGEANSGRERWAFAFSAKKTWKQKVRDDVAGIVGTGRAYDQIICVTGRFARSKDRSELEYALSTETGISVTIHDRSWIVKEIIENDRKDLAFNYLGVGQEVRNQFRLGPTDYSRGQQLEDIEKQMDDPAYYEGMETQLVSDALVAAKLSRNLEKPRFETDGRFVRAVRLAEAHGTYRQKLEARYEQIWTAFWYFDDIGYLNAHYDAFEKMALETDHAINVHFLCNLHQLVVNCVVHRWLSRKECAFSRRTATLRKALTEIAKNSDRPNNALEGRAALNVLLVNVAMLDGKRSELTAIWRDFSAVLNDARGMGEFDALRIRPLIETMGHVAGSDPAYNELIEDLATFVSERTSAGDGALTLLKRAQQLNFAQHFDMIRLLGRAALGLSKKEYAEQLVQALHLLALAYRSAELFWASRATCMFLAATLVVKGEEESELPVEFVPTMKLWALISLQLRHIPDFLFAVQMLNACLVKLPLADDSKVKVREDLTELDMMMGSVLLNIEEAELERLSALPDTLEALGLAATRSALLYALGYEQELRKDGSIPEAETEAGVTEFYSLYASQPVGSQYPNPLILNDVGAYCRETTLLGMAVQVTCDGNPQSILVSEAVLGTLEAFFATGLEHKVMPHTEKVLVEVALLDDIGAPISVVHELDMKFEIRWPKSLSITEFDRRDDVRELLVGMCGKVLAATCLTADMKDLLEKFFTTESVQHRINMVAISPNSHHRVTGRAVSTLQDWSKVQKAAFPLKPTRPTIERVDLTKKIKEKPSEDDEDGDGPSYKTHRGISVRSVIDIHAWNAAGWRGTAYLQLDRDTPPFVAFLFAHRGGAEKIFERWRERFGDHDANDDIALSFIRNLPSANKHHYLIHIAARLNEVAEESRALAMLSRSMTMTPNDSTNLENFLRSYKSFGCYYLLPAIFSGSGSPEFLWDLAILKQSFLMKNASDVTENDSEMAALRARKYVA